MKISIVTVCYNAAETIADTLDSIAAQDHADVEHIIIDGASTDATQDVVRSHFDRVAHFVSEPDGGIYDAMNKGFALASGDLVGILNADDVYAHRGVLSRVADVMTDTPLDACYADLVFVDRKTASGVIRYMRSCPYREELFNQGWMPPHPTLFVRRTMLARVGPFDTRFRLQSDFDFVLRLFRGQRANTRYVPETWVRMRMGGASNASVSNVLKGNWEAYLAARKNGLKVTPLFVARKILSRLPQFFMHRTA